MENNLWHWMGKIDCFGIKPEQRDELFNGWYNYAHETGGELQISQSENLLDTDRYEIYAVWSSQAKSFADFVWLFAQLIPEDHPQMTLQGYDRENCLRQDLLIETNQIKVVPYKWVAQDSYEYSPQIDLLTEE